jgi:hypothetical protein
MIKKKIKVCREYIIVLNHFNLRSILSQSWFVLCIYATQSVLEHHRQSLAFVNALDCKERTRFISLLGLISTAHSTQRRNMGHCLDSDRRGHLRLSRRHYQTMGLYLRPSIPRPPTAQPRYHLTLRFPRWPIGAVQRPGRYDLPLGSHIRRYCRPAREL